ncbi:ATP-binding protein [Bacillus alkalicellulosilyticus]|uniref:ATP-binding protein n=1 Tax=Alkalihalobacterium alkalicellulosilyticum TaxID=1912214 RepID=UPI0011168B0A|nr:ATP-binding protein [Bacillus alkalicellulosilyticus]
MLIHLINDLHEQTSIIITSNKGPKEWVQLLGVLDITTAILERLLKKVEFICMDGQSYRVKHHKSIFD